MSFEIRGILLFVASLLICPSAAWAQGDRPGIWDATIMPQPFEREPFRQIKVPRWVSDTSGCGYTLSVMDGQSRCGILPHRDVAPKRNW